jgi:hypothetical protein
MADPDPVQCFDDQKRIYIFLIKNCNLLIPRPLQRTSKLQEKPSAFKRKHSAIQNMNFIYFFFFRGSFFPSWIRIRIRILNADPDPATLINADPDPQPWERQCAWSLFKTDILEYGTYFM